MDKNKTIQFLECYENHPCLWNPKEHTYKNNNIRLATLKSIVQEMRLTLTVEELKAEIKNIRTTYSTEISKVGKSKKSGAGTDNMYKPQLIWFSAADRFLKPVVEGRQSKDNMSMESENSSYFDELGQGCDTEARKERKVFPKKSAERARSMDPPVLEAVGRLESLIQNIHQDEFDTFGQHVANQLRNLPLANAIISQNFINNYLSQQWLKNLNAQSPLTPRPTRSHSEYTRYTSTSGLSASEFSGDNLGTPHSRICEEDYFTGCVPAKENTEQEHQVDDDILSQAIRSCLD